MERKCQREIHVQICISLCRWTRFVYLYRKYFKWQIWSRKTINFHSKEIFSPLSDIPCVQSKVRHLSPLPLLLHTQKTNAHVHYLCPCWWNGALNFVKFPETLHNKQRPLRSMHRKPIGRPPRTTNHIMLVNKLCVWSAEKQWIPFIQFLRANMGFPFHFQCV